MRGGIGREFQMVPENWRSFHQIPEGTASDEITQEVGYGVYEESRPRLSRELFVKMEMCNNASY